jgi:hypothetical protein
VEHRHHVAGRRRAARGAVGPWGLLAVGALGVGMALHRAYMLEVSRRRMVDARATYAAALGRQREAEAELAGAQERARAAGWLVPTSEDFSVN